MLDRLNTYVATLRDDEGMSTIEYALGSLAAVALAGVLYTVVKSEQVVTTMRGVLTDALSTTLA